MTTAYRDAFGVGYQNIPYQGYPNQRMDMTRNRSYSLDANYKGAYAWGTFDAHAYWHQVFHKMGFLEDRFWLNHPMIALGRDWGYSLKAEVNYTEQDLFRIGNEFHGYRLQDYWTADWTGFPGALSRPFAQVNINGGMRNRLGTYLEWERRWAPQWTSLLGVRNDTIWMDTGPGQSYTPFATNNPNVWAVIQRGASHVASSRGRAQRRLEQSSVLATTKANAPASLRVDVRAHAAIT